ncbi:hypothetical protein [Amycolatopsis sp. EV170708-02-1]|uniref:hypothetical protein n=1 Tax=Amycolatopsis sp. EV170708-02-1 TaxID=2919322 RepID=UPI001F0CB761|nr:hypothetical protein [Amycolatopsis sp. EV170708-02-1]UMP06663.1 hypothetical protein MJQ72_18460 [Amycolatopsis sp. EV170708-02-1]
MTGSRADLAPGELLIAHARVRARDLGRRLESTMVDRQLYDELRRFLDEVGFPACDALDVLAGSGDRELRKRLHQVLGIEA